MADDQVVTNIVARADFSDLIANVRKVTTSLAAMQQQIGSSNKVLSAQINAVNRSFGETLRSTGQFSTHFVSLANDVDVFGKRLDGGKLKLRDYFSTLQTHTRTSGGLIRDLARQQVQLQNAILQPLGRNAQGLMQFNVHVPQGLDQIKNKGAIARQEMQILNKVMQEGSVGLINWGKNTQWAGRQLTVGLTVPIVAFGAAAAKAFREADQELTRLTKVYGGLSATSSSELQKVRRDVTAVANELARGYGSSFKETLALSADIAATGKQGSELLGSIRETTRLAVLGEVDRQDAMKATLAIQSAFRQDTDELAKSINFLNAVENQTSTSLADLVEAIPKAGPIIKGLGGDIEDLALYLTAMKEGGINASEGANAIKSALASLINPTDVAVKKFEGFGIDLMGIVNNNAGDVTKTLFALQGALNKLDPLQKSQAIEQLFGKFQFARLSALFENLGAQGSQTLKVLDLMKASSKDLESIASRELSMVTESASGKYRRAVEGLKADLAGVGEEFLKVSTFFINLVDGIVQFVNKLPAPVKTILTFLAGLTAVTGPLIMLTGVLANFLGYVIKGAFHLKALFKGGEGWRMLTPEILAANQAGSLIEKTFYSDAKAALALAEALQVLSAGMTSIQSKMTQGVVSVQPMLSTVAGSVIKPPGDDDGPGGGGGIGRVVDPKNPLVGPVGTRASAHMVPRSGMSQEERAAQTIHSFLPAPIPVNQAVGANPQIFAAGDLPSIPGLTTIPGRGGQVSTGVVASEAAKWHTMVGALSMMTKTEVAQMKTQIRTTGTVTSEFTQAFGSLLPQMTSIASSAASQSAMIVAEAKAGTISVQTARQRIIALNIQVEQLMAQATMGTASSLGRTAVLTGVPTLDQPVVDPKTGKSNMRELFKKGKTRSFVDDLARLMGVRTWGAGYSTHTTIPIRRNMGGKVYNPEVHGNVVPGDTSINYDNTPAVLREGGFILNQSSSRVNPDLVSLAKNSKNAGGKIVPAILTPGETYFPPEIAQEIMPTLEKANSGSVIKLLNAGGMLGGRVSSKKLNYGVRISPIDILSKLGRWNPNMARGARRVYETRASGSRASNSPRTFDPGSANGPEAYHSLFRRSSGTWGVHGGALRHGERSADEVLGHVITSKFLRQFKGLPDQGSSRVLTGSQFESRFGSMPGGATASKKYQVLPDNLITITKDFNAALLNGNATGAMWLGSNRQPQHFISLLSHLLNSGVPYKVAYRVAGRTLDRINKAMYRLKDTNLTETKWGNIVDSSMQAEISALSRSYTKGSMHSFNAGGAVPGGMVSRNRFGYGIPALSAAVIARLTSKWKKPAPYAPPTQKHDWTNTDPLHGPLFIGRADIGSDGTRRSLSYNIPSGRIVQGREGRQLVGISPMMSNDPRYLIERYMQGDKSVLSRMQYEAKNGLNSHPLSIQSLFKSVSRRFRGTLYRGMTPQSVADTFPKHIVEAIERARATGDFSQLIGRAFIMRRASFTADPRLAQFFAPGSGGLVLQASLSGRRVTPTSEIFPDQKFQAPYGQDWSRGVSSRRYRSEQESLVGGRFIITGFDGKKLIVEGRAMGGPVSGATPYVVGERGPELFVPKNSGGIIPNYALGGVVKGGKINYGVVPSGNPVADLITQSLSMPTLDSQMRAGSVDLSAYGLGSGELAPLQTPQSPQMSKGPRGMGIAGMLGGLGGMSLGSMLGSQLTGGNQLGNILGGMLGYGAGDAALKALTAKMQGFGNAAGGAAGKTSLLAKAFEAFVGLPGPLKLLAGVVGVAGAVKVLNDKINEHKRIVSAGFGVSEESAKKLGLSYTKLGSQVDEYRKKLDLANAAAAANKYATSLQGGPGIDLTVPQFEKLKKSTKKDFATEISMFDTANEEEALERATNLKAAYVATGMSVEDANALIYAMLENSNKAHISLKILADSGFSSLDTKAKAAERTFKTFADVITKGDMDQLPIALQTASDAFSELQKSMINTTDNSKELVTSGEAYERVLQQILNTNELNNEIGRDGLFQILKQNESLKGIISSSDTFAGVLAKIKLSTSGIVFDLENMSSATAAALSIVLEKQKDFLLAAEGPFSSLVNKINSIGKISADQIVKNANRTKESIQAEIALRQKNIQKIKDEADAKKKALEEETEAEDFLLQIQKKQIEYSEALASGNMAGAAQAQLDIQSMTGSRQLDLAKTAIDDKADKDIRAEQKKIDALNNKMTSLEKNLQKSIDAANLAQKQSANLKELLDELGILVLGAQDGMSDSEKNRAALLSKKLRDAGFGNLADQYLMPSVSVGSGYASSALGPGMVATPTMDYDKVMALANKSLKFAISGGLLTSDPEVLEVLKAMKNGMLYGPSTKVSVSRDNFPGYGRNVFTVKSNALEAEGIKVKPGTVFVDKNGNPYRVGQPLPSQYQSDLNPENKIYRVDALAAGGMIKNFMPGGKVKGPGTETSDSIPAYLSDGEYVIRAASVKKYGVEAMDALNAGKFANGGPVNTSALITPSIPYYMNDGGSVSNQLPYFPWRHDLPNYWSNGRPTGDPRTGRWGELRYNPSKGKDIWGGTEIPGLKFTGKTPQQSDYWHQMLEQPNKNTALGMAIEKDLMRLVGSGASMGGIGSGVYGFGPLMLARGGKAIKTALGWIAKTLSKIQLPKLGNYGGLESRFLNPFKQASPIRGIKINTVSGMEDLISQIYPEGTYTIDHLTGLKVPQTPYTIQKQFRFPKGAAGYYTNEDQILHSRFDGMDAGTVIHELGHHIDLLDSNLSAKIFFDSLKNDVRPEQILQMRHIFDSGNAAKPGYGPDALEMYLQQLFIDKGQYANLAGKYRAIQEGTVTDQVSIIHKRLMASGKTELARQIGDPYAGDRVGYVDNFYQMATLLDNHPEWKSPGYPEGMIAAGKVMPQKFKDKFLLYAQLMEEAGINPSTPSNDPKWMALKRFALRSGFANGGMVNNFAEGGYANPSSLISSSFPHYMNMGGEIPKFGMGGLNVKSARIPGVKPLVTSIGKGIGKFGTGMFGKIKDMLTKRASAGILNRPDAEFKQIVDSIYKKREVFDFETSSKVPVYTMGDSGDQFAFQGYKEDLSGLSDTGIKIVPTDPISLLQAALKLNPKDKNIKLMLKKFLAHKKTGKGLREEELNFLDQMSASAYLDGRGEYVSTVQPDGFAMLLASLSGNKNAKNIVAEKTKIFKDIQEKSKAEYFAPPQNLSPEEAINASQIPIIHSTSRQVVRQPDGSVHFYPRGNWHVGDPSMAFPRSSVHTTAGAPVQDVLGGKWDTSNTRVFATLDKVLDANPRPYTINPTDTWFPVDPGKPFIMPKGSVIDRVFKNKKEYITELMKRGLFNGVGEPPLVVSDPKTNEVLRISKKVYTDADREQMASMIPKTEVNRFTDGNDPAMRGRTWNFGSKADQLIGIEELILNEISEAAAKKQLKITSPITQISGPSLMDPTMTSNLIAISKRLGVPYGANHQGSPPGQMESNTRKEGVNTAGVFGGPQDTAYSGSYTDSSSRYLALHGLFPIIKKLNPEYLNRNGMPRQWGDLILAKGGLVKKFDKGGLAGDTHGGKPVPKGVNKLLNPKMGYLKSAKIGGTGGLVYGAMEEAEKYLSLRWGANENASGFSKWGRALGRVAFNTVQGTATGLVAGRNPLALFGGMAAGLVEGLIGLAKDGSQYGVKGGAASGQKGFDAKAELDAIGLKSLLSEMAWSGGTGMVANPALMGLGRLAGKGFNKYVMPKLPSSVKEYGYNALESIKGGLGKFESYFKGPKPGQYDIVPPKVPSYFKKDGLENSQFRQDVEGVPVLNQLSKIVTTPIDRINKAISNFNMWDDTVGRPRKVLSAIDGILGLDDVLSTKFRPKTIKDSVLSMYKTGHSFIPESKWGFLETGQGEALMRSKMGMSGKTLKETYIEQASTGAEKFVEKYGSFINKFNPSTWPGMATTAKAALARWTPKKIGSAVSSMYNTGSSYDINNTSRNIYFGGSSRGESFTEQLIRKAEDGPEKFVQKHLRSLYLLNVKNMINSGRTKFGVLRSKVGNAISLRAPFLLPGASQLTTPSFIKHVEHPGLKAILESFYMRHRVATSTSNPTGTLPKVPVHPSETEMVTGRTRGPGIYFGLTSRLSREMYNFGKNVYRPKMNLEMIKTIFKSQGYIKGTPQLNALIDEFNATDIGKATRDVFAESGQAGAVRGGLAGLTDYNHPIIKFLMDKGFIGYMHGHDENALTAATNWLIGMKPSLGYKKVRRASGGIVTDADKYTGGNMNIPKFEKGINMVPADMLAMLHKNEAVVPANMNPFNPNAQSYSQPSISYNISPVINAAPGMDEQAIANMATRQVLAEIKVIDARNNASMGRPGTRVVGK